MLETSFIIEMAAILTLLFLVLAAQGLTLYILLRPKSLPVPEFKIPGTNFLHPRPKAKFSPVFITEEREYEMEQGRDG